MQIFQRLAGFSLGKSDVIRRAMSKKKAAVIINERKSFIEGCLKNGIDEKAAGDIFDEMLDFGKYAFNKSHAAAYAVIGYQTAYLKLYFPAEFMAALLTSVMGGAQTKTAEYIDECKKMNVEILPPDINESLKRFTVSDGKIRFGLSGVKNVGRQTLERAIKERENGKYVSMTDFISRMDRAALNKRGLESLIKAGAFDSLGGTRKQYMTAYKSVADGVALNKKNNIDGQLDFFSLAPDAAPRDEFFCDDEYDKKTLLEMEKEVLGIYVSGHPLEEYMDFLEKYTDADSLSFEEGKRVKVGGIIREKTIKYTKTNNAMAFITLEDLRGAFEVIVFPKVYEKNGAALKEGVVALVSGTVNSRDDEDMKILADEITFEEDLRRAVWLKRGKDCDVKKIISIIDKYPGQTRVIVYDEASKTKSTLNKKITLNENILSDLKNLLGSDSIAVAPVKREKTAKTNI
jgi:DNA polymerase-3 subunit alpha